MPILVDGNSRVLVQGITGREAGMVVAHSLAYGTPILAGVTPGKGGGMVHGVPVYDTVEEAVREHPLNTSLISVPPAFVLDAALEALEEGIPLLVVATERVPVHDTAKILAYSREIGATLIGPNSVGIISPGDRVKVGAIGGDRPERCFFPGRVGVISRSGGMTAECSWMVRRAGHGVSTSVSTGGDPLIGMTPAKLLRLFEEDVETDGVLLFGEPGTTFEEEAAKMISRGEFKKPLIAFIAGRFTEGLPEGTVFGHAAAIISGGRGRPSDKARALREAGALVAESFNELIPLLKIALSP